MCRNIPFWRWRYREREREREEREREREIPFCLLATFFLQESWHPEAEKRPEVKAMPRKPAHPANPPSWTQQPWQERIVQGSVVEKSLHDYGMVSACVSI